MSDRLCSKPRNLFRMSRALATEIPRSVAIPILSRPQRADLLREQDFNLRDELRAPDRKRRPRDQRGRSPADFRPIA